MAQRPEGNVPKVDENNGSNKITIEPRRSTSLWFGLLVVLLLGIMLAYRVQFGSLPAPLTADQAGKRGFSEESAMKHVKYLTGLGPHPVGSHSLDFAVEYVHAAAQTIKKSSHWEVDVQVELFHANTAANRIGTGLFKGKTLLYSDMKNVVLRIVPKYLPEAEENLILVSSHIDTVFSAEGAGDCSSCIAVMLELARGISQWAHGFKSGVIFLFNTGEEEGLNGAHSFMTQHRWSNSVRFAIDLEAMGIGGKSILFQTGGFVKRALEIFAEVSKNPSAQIMAQDVFLSGAIKSGTDFQVYREIGALPGLDFAFTDNTVVYHTKNDKLKLLTPGSLQHLGDNMLAFLNDAAASQDFLNNTEPKKTTIDDHGRPVFFDVLGMHMIVYSQKLATMLHNSLIFQSLLILAMSLFMGGYPGLVSFGLTMLSILLMWIFSISLSVLVAFVLPFICPSPVPYVANQWLLAGLFGAPALLGAFLGQHIGFILLRRFIRKGLSVRASRASRNPIEYANLDAERWIYKSGLVQWMILLILGNYYNVGSTYVALLWLASPAFAYGLMEATLSPSRSPKPMKVVTLIIGMVVPIISSTGMIFHLLGVIAGTAVRSVSNPGGQPEWLWSVIVAIAVSIVVCLVFVYLLSYIHLSGAKRYTVLLSIAMLAITLNLVSTGIVPAYTDDVARAVNVVHVVESSNIDGHEPSSYVSLFSTTPGKFTKEMEYLEGEEFVCGRNITADFATFNVKYSCWTHKNSNAGWSQSEVPELHVQSDLREDTRKTVVSIDTKLSTRWALAINKQEISDFVLEGDLEELIPADGNKEAVDGWHIIQFAGGRESPTKFMLTLFWSSNVATTASSSQESAAQALGARPLLKLRTDVNRVTPMTAKVLEKLPSWCSLYGKSTSPYTLAFLTSLPVDF